MYGLFLKKESEAKVQWLIFGIHHAYQVRVLLAVETQAGSGCAVPNRTVLTRTAQWKQAIKVPFLTLLM